MIESSNSGRSTGMSSLNEFTSKKVTHLWPITLLRVYTGVFFTYYGFGKISRGGFADSMEGDLNGWLESSYGFMRPFLESVVIPNKAIFGVMVSWGELMIGLALIAGLATRYASIAGAVMVASFWFAKGQGFISAQNHDAVWFMIFIVLATIHAGRIHSLDAKLADRFRFLA
jgi:thiosulfate dehydrogenase [quinone] large subunit